MDERTPDPEQPDPDAQLLDERTAARLIGVSERTAKAHVQAILAKLESADRAEAVDAAYKRGLLRVDRN